MTDAEISRQLAIAIGWPESSLYNEGDGSFCAINISEQPFIERWRDFDYRDPAVIWPIAERYDAFPAVIGVEWDVYIPATQTFVRAGTAARAVALAVIKAHEEKK